MSTRCPTQPQPTNTRQQRGQNGEELAAQWLQAQGFQIVARNWRPGGRGASGGAMRGEVDIIAWQERVLCFVEVKTRVSNERGAPQEAVTISKQRQICRLANAFVGFHQLHEVACRFDVVEVWLPPGEAPRLQMHANAFDYIAPSRGARVF